MHPNNPSQTQMPAGPSTNPYDFIMNENPKPKRRWLPGGNSKGQRLAIIAIIVVVILLLGIVLYGVFTASSSAGTADMVSAVQQQQEIARIADIGAAKARQTETKYIAVMTAETMRSDQASLTAYLKKNRKKISSKELNATKSSATDSSLDKAEQANSFDSTFTATLAKELSAYQKTAKDAHDHTSSASAKKILEQMYAHTALLNEKLQKLNTGSQ